MAGKRTMKRQPFQGETWADETGQTYELEHEGRLVRVRFYKDGELHYATKGDPLVMTLVKVGKGASAKPPGWQAIVLRPAEG